jgi:OOP family OmpA-OmpF porin
MIERFEMFDFVSIRRAVTMKNKFFLLTILAVLLIGSAIRTNAQNRITVGELMTSLNKTGSTAQKVGIDTASVRRDIQARIQAEGGENAISPPPVSEILRKLPNFIVQIQFNLDSDVIRPESWEIVGKIADALYHPLLAGNRFLIVGHTDASGKRQYNLELSEKRAASVVEVLTTTFRVPRQRLLPIGFGEEQIFDTADPEAAVNRRVEIINLGPL